MDTDSNKEAALASFILGPSPPIATGSIVPEMLASNASNGGSPLDAAAYAAVTASATVPQMGHPQPIVSRSSLERTTSSQDTAADLAGDAELYAVVTPEMLQLPPTEWKAKWRLIAGKLTANQHKRAKVLRRRALSCLYARRSRQKRAAQMSKLVDTNTVLATENMQLQQNVQQPQGHASSSSSSGVHVAESNPPVGGEMQPGPHAATLAAKLLPVLQQQQQQQQQHNQFAARAPPASAALLAPSAIY